MQGERLGRHQRAVSGHDLEDVRESWEGLAPDPGARPFEPQQRLFEGRDHSVFCTIEHDIARYDDRKPLEVPPAHL
ncbi:hypothetical protein D9M72_530650 [compost metagenome]